MGKRVSPTLVGAFVIGALTLAVVTILLLGSGRFFTGKHSYVLYFDRDVNGLRVGAPVKFRGVDIGSVTAVQLSLNGLDSPRPNRPPDVHIPVLVEIDSRKMEAHKAADDLSEPRVMAHAIKLGLRGQLQMQSFVTGLLYVDLDMHPGAPERIVMGSEAPYPEIPTLPTALEEAQQTAAKIIAQIDKADIPAMVHSLTQTAAGINHFVNSPKLENSFESLNEASRSLKDASLAIGKLARDFDAQVGPLSTSLRDSAKAATVALNQVQLTLDHVEHTVEPHSPLSYQLEQTLADVSSAANAVHSLADYLERNPSSLVRGRYTRDNR